MFEVDGGAAGSNQDETDRSIAAIPAQGKWGCKGREDPDPVETASTVPYNESRGRNGTP
jgi:hypothetical protein